jgi:uncharacterized protein YwgA
MPTSEDLFGLLFLINSFGLLKNRIRLQKLVVIAKYKHKYDFSFKFIKYLHGPYSLNLQIFVDDLIKNGLVEESKKNTNEYEYKLTELGKKLFSEIKGTVKKNDLKKLEKTFSECHLLEVPMLVSNAKEAFGW